MAIFIRDGSCCCGTGGEFSCCCGNVSGDSTFTVSWDGNLWEVPWFSSEQGICKWIFVDEEASGEGIPKTIGVVIEEVFGDEGLFCGITCSIIDDALNVIYSSFYYDIGEDGCCDITSMELPDDYNTPPGVSAYVTIEC